MNILIKVQVKSLAIKNQRNRLNKNISLINKEDYVSLPLFIYLFFLHEFLHILYLVRNDDKIIH